MMMIMMVVMMMRSAGRKVPPLSGSVFKAIDLVCYIRYVHKPYRCVPTLFSNITIQFISIYIHIHVCICLEVGGLVYKAIDLVCL
jgi:hypothetical protein